MRKLIFFLAPLFLFSGVTSYKMEVTLEIKGRYKVFVKGREVIQWENNAKVPVDRIPFHLYQNAFRKGSSFMKEIGGLPRKWKKHEEWWGKEEIKRITVNGKDLTGTLKFVQPDDGNAEDRTVAEITLTEPVKPGDQLTIEVEFVTKLPKAYARSGSGVGYYFVSQWFPKPGVLLDDGKWVCHQYHRNGEFFSDFSTYEVKIKAPSHLVITANGELVKQEKSGKNQLLLFRQERVHDFVWVADKDFIKVEDRFSSPKQPEVKILLFIQPAHLRQKGRYLEAIKRALKFYSEKIGPYPYKRITIIDPDISAMRTSGMEYPTLITGASLYLLPKGIKFTEDVTIHEFGHQYWYGVVANNETDEAWLDEGVNTFFEENIMDTYPWFFDILGHKARDSERLRLGYIKSTYADPIITPSWKFFPGSYSANVYIKAALTLETWKRLVGEDKFFSALREYYKKYAFSHPTSSDFFNTMEQYLGDWSGLWKPMFYRAGKVNWKVYGIWGKEVILLRQGLDVEVPVEVEVETQDGEKHRFVWEGKWLKKNFGKKIVKVTIDPDEKLMIDANPFDNRWARKSPVASRLAWHLLVNIQAIFLNLLP